MEAALKQLVRKRGNGRCEYCSLPQAGTLVPFAIDHIIARKHRGRTVARNLANSRIYCNAYKGPNIAGLDLAKGRLNGLFHPRRHNWMHHLRYQDGILMGRTAIWADDGGAIAD